jgi:mercuric ion transport protein
MSTSQKSGTGMLAASGIAVVLASTCCLGPLVLVSLGFTGAWIGTLSILEPYRPFFLVVTTVTLVLAGFRVFRPVQACAPGDLCCSPQSRRYQRMVFVAVTVLALLAFVFPYLARFFY